MFVCKCCSRSVLCRDVMTFLSLVARTWTSRALEGATAFPVPVTPILRESDEMQLGASFSLDVIPRGCACEFDLLLSSRLDNMQISQSHVGIPSRWESHFQAQDQGLC